MITRPGRARRRHPLFWSRVSLFWRRPSRIALVAAITTVGFFASPGVASAGGYETIEGSGSSWAAIAINQWIYDAKQFGLTVNYNPNGSAEGRQQYEQGGEVDFAGSDPPFRDGDDKLAGTSSELPFPWSYSYVPDTAGGTAFMYHLTVGGHQVRNLRLSGQVLMEIFTGTITNWDDPRISAIYGAHLPNEPITPVLRSDGSGATYFFTLWMSTQFPTQWNQFCEKVHPGITLPCGNTEFYPQFGDAKEENGSISVANYITASYGEGTIGYDEYAYALADHYPVVQLLNKANYFVGPTASNVAIALEAAKINEDRSSASFLQQSLGSVYTDTDPRTYPLSSYSYLIVPRTGGKPPPFFNDSAGASLSKFIDYFLCQGQGQISSLGYSPLPFNLVSGAFEQVNDIPGHVSTPNIAHYANCGNPTFRNGVNVLTKDAPYPTKCQKLGAPLDCGGGGGGSGGSGSGGSGGSGGKGSGGKGSGGSGANGNPAAGGTGGNTGTGQNAAQVTGTVVNLAGNGTDRAVLSGLTALAIVFAVATPPVLGTWLRRRKRRAGA